MPTSENLSCSASVISIRISGCARKFISVLCVRRTECALQQPNGRRRENATYFLTAANEMGQLLVQRRQQYVTLLVVALQTRQDQIEEFAIGQFRWLRIERFLFHFVVAVIAVVVALFAAFIAVVFTFLVALLVLLSPSINIIEIRFLHHLAGNFHDAGANTARQFLQQRNHQPNARPVFRYFWYFTLLRCLAVFRFLRRSVMGQRRDN